MSACRYCGGSFESGVTSNGDPYGQGKEVLPVREWGFACWDCYKTKGHAEDQARAAEINAAFVASGRCAFLRSWIGRCGAAMPCAEHSVIKCGSCGAQATHDCSETGALVCGVPLCDECEHGKRDAENPGFFGLSGGHARKAAA